MKQLNKYIVEKLKLNKDISTIKHNYQPETADELRKLLKKLISERGKDADLNDIDVSKIEKLSPIKNPWSDGYDGLFEDLDPHNIDISSWDVSNSTGFGAMFWNCENFDCDLSDWDMSKAKEINTMFRGCKKFTGKGLEKWNIKNVKGMNEVFMGCNESIIPSWYKKR